MNNRNLEIIKRFKESWIEIRNRFIELINNYEGFENLKPIIVFIDELKVKEFDNFFRLGTSMHRLIISRSVDYGLRKDQKYIMIESIGKRFEISLKDGEKTYSQFIAEDLNDLKIFNLIETLKKTLAD